jgi:hypothetical protein
MGDRLSEDADDHGHKTEDAEDDGACHGVPLLSFFGLLNPFCLLSNLRESFGFIFSKYIYRKKNRPFLLFPRPEIGKKMLF